MNSICFLFELSTSALLITLGYVDKLQWRWIICSVTNTGNDKWNVLVKNTNFFYPLWAETPLYKSMIKTLPLNWSTFRVDLKTYSYLNFGNLWHYTLCSSLIWKPMSVVFTEWKHIIVSHRKIYTINNAYKTKISTTIENRPSLLLQIGDI